MPSVQKEAFVFNEVKFLYSRYFYASSQLMRICGFGFIPVIPLNTLKGETCVY